MFYQDMAINALKQHEYNIPHAAQLNAISSNPKFDCDVKSCVRNAYKAFEEEFEKTDDQFGNLERLDALVNENISEFFTYIEWEEVYLKEI